MAKLVVGRFEDVDHTKRLLEALPEAGFGRREYGLFYVAPPGQHALYPIGGDAYSDEGAKHAGETAATGAAVGGVTGLAAGAVAAATLPFGGWIVALAATGVGAYLGSFMGALSGTEQGTPSEATTEQPVEQPGGPRVAICVDRPGTEQAAIALLRRFGAKDIGRAEGEWREGEWKDFDPRVPPAPVGSSPSR
jgi:hypothetical protein